MYLRGCDLADYLTDDLLREIEGLAETWPLLWRQLRACPQFSRRAAEDQAVYRLWYARIRMIGREQTEKSGFPALALAVLLTQARLQAPLPLSSLYAYAVEPEEGDDPALLSAGQSLRALNRASAALACWQQLAADAPAVGLTAWSGLAQAGQALTAAAAAFLCPPPEWGQYTAAEVAAGLSVLSQGLSGLCQDFYAAQSAYMGQLRGLVNSPAECCRLAAANEAADEQTALAIFPHGTCVSLSRDELRPGENIAAAACRLLAAAAGQGPLEFMELDEVSAQGDTLSCAYQSAMDGMNGICSYYWQSEDWWSEDEDLQRVYRQADRQENPCRIIGGWER